VRNIAEVATAVARGDLSRKITVDVKGEILALKTRSTRWWTNSTARSRGDPRGARGCTEGELGGQAVVPGVGGTWKD